MFVCAQKLFLSMLEVFIFAQLKTHQTVYSKSFFLLLLDSGSLSRVTMCVKISLVREVKPVRTFPRFI